jgi:hypothetical protein
MRIRILPQQQGFKVPGSTGEKQQGKRYIPGQTSVLFYTFVR